MNVSVKDLENKAKSIEKQLKENGFNCKIGDYSHNGMYEYVLDFYPVGKPQDGLHRQLCTELGTKKEVFYSFDTIYYKALENKEFYTKF